VRKFVILKGQSSKEQGRRGIEGKKGRKASKSGKKMFLKGVSRHV